MKRIKNILVVMVMMILGFTFDVKAQEFRYYLTNDKENYEFVDKNNAKTTTVKRGDTITVVAVLDNMDNVVNHQISDGKLILRWDEKYLELVNNNGKYYNDAISDISDLSLGTVTKANNKLTINDISSTGSLKPGKNKLVEFKFNVLTDTVASDTKIFQMDGEEIKCYNVDEERTVNCGESLYSELKYTIAKSAVNKLSMIKIDNQELEFFDENQNDYVITVEGDVEKIKIDAVKKDSRSVITGDIGEKKLTYGFNKLTITVTSESGNKNIYNINVTREDNRSNDNSLSNLYLTDGEIEFSPNTLEYTVNVTNSIDRLTIISSLNDPKAKYVTDYSNKEITLNEGSNKVEIKILSEKGEERTYTLNINRALSSNNSLKILKIDGKDVGLRENEFIYYYSVDNEIDRITLEAETNDPRATAIYKDTYDLVIGENEVTVKVKAPGGQEISYIINITRKKLLSEDSLLKNLVIEGYKIDFKPDETLYDLKIKDTDNELTIKTVTDNENATVTIDGNKDLENGSIIKINVQAENGTYTRYFINIIKGNSGISPILIIIIVLLLLLAVCLGIIIYRKKRQENKKFEDLNTDDDPETPPEDVTPVTEETKEVKEEVPEEKKVLETEYDDKEKDA